uniref:Protein phosphatase 1 regulatory subunit 42 n=1 Tax=Knipowitschia caucasica TaxID=637954 RepID=A0AAV2L6Z9_KNICA
MQNNNLTAIDNLSHLKKLTKLYLGGNKIAVVEGLNELSELRELHLENQRLAPGEKLLFDRMTFRALSASLCVLNINNNNIDDLRDLEALKELQQFSATDNRLENILKLEDVVSNWPNLVKMDLSGNPVCKQQKYKDRLIIVCRKLVSLDGREIKELTRQFLINWKASKEAQKNRKQQTMISYPMNDFSFHQTQLCDPSYGYTSYNKWMPQATLKTQRLMLPVSGL